MSLFGFIGEAVEEAVDELSTLEQAVSSSHLLHVQYDRLRGVLRITFRNGATYTYPGLSESDYNSLVEAASPGSHFWRHIRGR